MTAEDSKAALRTFDEHSHLMTLIDPSSIVEQLHTAGLLPTDHPTSLTTGLVMEKLLKHIRSCVELKGAEMFINYINVLHSDGRYGVLGDHLFGETVYILYVCSNYNYFIVGTYKSHGGHGNLVSSINSSPGMYVVYMCIELVYLTLSSVSINFGICLYYVHSCDGAVYFMFVGTIELASKTDSCWYRVMLHIHVFIRLHNYDFECTGSPALLCFFIDIISVQLYYVVIR